MAESGSWCHFGIIRTDIPGAVQQEGEEGVFYLTQAQVAVFYFFLKYNNTEARAKPGIFQTCCQNKNRPER